MRPVPLPLPDPPLVEGSLALRAWAPEDAAALAAAWTDPAILRWTGVPARHDETAAGRWIAGEADRRARGISLDLVIELGGTVGGEVGLAQLDLDERCAEMGWWTGPDHRGLGVAGRAAGMLAQWALSELVVETIIARCHRDNPASGGAARRAGFVLDNVTDGVELWRCC